MLLRTKNTIKIPKDIKIIYCDKTNLLVIIGPLTKQTVELDVKIVYIKKLDLIGVTKIPVANIYSKNNLKNFKKVQGTTIAKIKQSFIETSNTLYHKLDLVGVGYRAFDVENVKNQICLKLGYSHLIYHKIPKDLNIFCVKLTKLFLFGTTSYLKLTQTASSIRNCKLPEPYKGKGILHHQEKVSLKKGKKI